ncbi:hypothetical protein CI109_100247 [Kwoniella shandongensis]|uniref:Nudix hydrolase domain-containing protein n=1 Tax=Kwoniella shandongensis TaxID=1734106 RepID=A0AAJ8LBA2_9TREE
MGKHDTHPGNRADTKPPRHVAVAIVFSPNTRKILMITSRAHPHLWILPKGGIEHGESSGQAAVRESYEEAGTPSDVPPPTDEDRLVVLSLPSKKRSAIWHVHVLEVDQEVVESTSTWPESHQRQRAWFTPSAALENIQQWYTDESAKKEVDPGTDLEDEHEQDGKKGKGKVKESGEERRGKKDKKGGAMEEALRKFITLKGLDI